MIFRENSIHTSNKKHGKHNIDEVEYQYMVDTNFPINKSNIRQFHMFIWHQTCQTCLSQGWAYTFSCQHIQKNWDLDSTLKLYSEVGDMNPPTSHCNITARGKRLQRGGSTQTTWPSSIWNEIWFSWDLDLVKYLWRSIHSTEKWAARKSRREQRE